MPFSETRFALARALWDAPIEAGRERERARELADLAREAYVAKGEQATEELAALDTWLSELEEP